MLQPLPLPSIPPSTHHLAPCVWHLKWENWFIRKHPAGKSLARAVGSASRQVLASACRATAAAASPPRTTWSRGNKTSHYVPPNELQSLPPSPSSPASSSLAMSTSLFRFMHLRSPPWHDLADARHAPGGGDRFQRSTCRSDNRKKRKLLRVPQSLFNDVGFVKFGCLYKTKMSRKFSRAILQLVFDPRDCQTVV